MTCPPATRHAGRTTRSRSWPSTGTGPAARAPPWSRRSAAAAVASTPKSWSARLRRERKRVGVASVYRALALLSELGVLQRVPVAGGSARYELAGPGGDHHHHLVCDDCGATTPFEDEALERAIGRLSRRTAYAVQAHDVTLHGTCPDCQSS